MFLKPGISWTQKGKKVLDLRINTVEPNSAKNPVRVTPTFGAPAEQRLSLNSQAEGP